MSILSEGLRPFWLLGLNERSGRLQTGTGGWICDEEYQIYSPVKPNSFVLSFAEPSKLLDSFAADINRIGSASFESALSIARSAILPKSLAWLVVQTYYSPFFSAHALLRMLGESCAPIEREQAKSIDRVATIFGKACTTPMSGGLYHLRCDMARNELHGTALAGSPHEVFWNLFHRRILELSEEMLSVSTLQPTNRQAASIKLFELASNLNFASAGRGRWLSSVRNAVNYSQKYAAWYPYSNQQEYCVHLFEKTKEWQEDPISVDLISHHGKDLRRFQATCNFILALFRASLIDMSHRCSTGRSFHEFGSLSCLHRANCG